MELKTTGELSGVAEVAPQLFMDASLGRGEYEGEAFNREPGIQLTKEQIISLRKYEELGLSLPVEIGSIRDYLRYGEGDSGGVGLKVEDFQKTFKMTFDHAARWRPLREKIMQTGTDLDIFSTRILSTGGDIVKTYEKLEISGFLKEHGIDTIEEYLKLKDQLPNIPSIEVPEGVVDDIGYYLGVILDDIKKCHATAEVVRGSLDSFGADMRTQVLPEIKLRMRFVSDNTYAQEIKVLQARIDEYADQIDELNKKYDELVKQAIASAIVSPIGLIVGIFLGVKAEQIRRDRNELRQKQSVDNKLMASKNQTLSSLNRVRDDLQNLNYVAIEAEVATQNLMLVWNSLSLFIKGSFEDLQLVEEATKLSRLISAIKRVINPWEDVKNNTDPLLEVFRAADREYEEGNARFQARSAFMLTISDFSMDQLVDHNGVVQDADVNAQMLSQKYSYLPGPVGTMHTLAGSIREKTYGVKVQCQEIDIKLKRCTDNLEWLLEDLVDTPEDDDVPAKIETELQTARGILSERSGKFIGWKRDISGRFDRGFRSSGWRR
ncbi:alpha-xenorhabdolysin family binary toxin subunit A [Pseudomonas sp. NMS19W]|uniref:alpha-xenorhabdolysin family binary toxin subunit A n=1 Tax=Pseudomonas sp. NMS19W TaxID=3079768 RepID=UPI003F65E19B